MEVDDAVRVIAKSLDYPCAERLQPNLVWMAQHLERHGELATTPRLMEKLGKISISTWQRTMGGVLPRRDRIAHRRTPHGLGRRITKDIPMRRIAWEEGEAGHFEIDLVHHGGDNTAGQYVHTLQMTDVSPGWSECVATLGRSYLVMEDGFRCCLQRLPFAVKELHPDNGSEFLNHHILRFWGEILPEAGLSRSRPFSQNDNRFVEENNYSLVRAYGGYQRLDTVAQTLQLNQLFEHLWLYHNFFLPVMRLKEKLVFPDQPARYKRIYDQAHPPFDRLCAQQVLSAEKQEELHALREATNPCQLRDQINYLIGQLFALPCASNGTPENVHLTLGWWQQSPPPTS